MMKLYPENLLTVITNNLMNERIIVMLKKYGVSGYTIDRRYP